MKARAGGVYIGQEVWYHCDVQKPLTSWYWREGWVTAVISGLGMIRQVQSCLHWQKDDDSGEW